MVWYACCDFSLEYASLVKSAWYVFPLRYFTYTGCSIPGVSYLVCYPWLCDSWDNIAGTSFLVRLLGAWYTSPVGRLFPVYCAWHIIAVVRHILAVVRFSWYIIPGINTAWYQVYCTWHVMPGVFFLGIYISASWGEKLCCCICYNMEGKKQNIAFWLAFFFLSGSVCGFVCWVCVVFAFSGVCLVCRCVCDVCEGFFVFV